MTIIKNTSKNILSHKYWKNLKSFKNITGKETQIKYYERNNSCKEVLELVRLESKPFGCISEKIIREIFNIGERTSSENDGIKHGKKIEIKSARYWAGKDNCIWQHLEPTHDYDYALFTLLDFNGWKIWCIKKSTLMGELRNKNLVKFQGKQGWWAKKSLIINHLTEIHTIEDLEKCLKF